MKKLALALTVLVAGNAVAQQVTTVYDAAGHPTTHVKSGNMSLATVLAKDSDETVGKMKVSSVLESMPGVGKVRARKIMEKLDISASRRVRGLGSKQKDALLAEFGGKK